MWNGGQKVRCVGWKVHPHGCCRSCPASPAHLPPAQHPQPPAAHSHLPHAFCWAHENSLVGGTSSSEQVKVAGADGSGTD